MHRLATHLRTHLQRRTRGQSLVEFALVLPIIMMLTLTALDFGRVYLGYINLQNMARIAANFAANNPTSWTASTDPAILLKHQEAQLKYQNEILGDAAATNCDLPIVAGKKTAPDPTFTDADADGTPEIGDKAQVSISCTFGVITPVIGNIVGGSIKVSAASTFPVKTGMTVTAGPPPAGSAPNAAFSGNGVQAPNSITGTLPFTVDFRDTSGGNPTSWLWTFNDGSIPGTATTQDALAHVFAGPGTFVVSMKATNSYGSSTAFQSVTVTIPTTVDFNISQPTPTAPSAVTFTSSSAPGGTNYAWTYGTGQGGDSGASLTTTSHTYNTVGTFTVTLTVTYPTGPVSVSKSVTVTSSLCLVPSLDKIKRNQAQAHWSLAGFSGSVTDGAGAPVNDYTIKTQTEVAGDTKPCTIGVVVNSK
jgi:PKD repeat protein